MTKHNSVILDKYIERAKNREFRYKYTLSKLKNVRECGYVHTMLIMSDQSLEKYTDMVEK
tara:strand:+ start:3753 stop:3932 length:180 start_codon:yes stop_codon:yes gene_type:complete